MKTQLLCAALRRACRQVRCRGLRCMAALFHRRCRAAGPAPGTNRILVIRTDRIGDMTLSTPALRALKAAFPASVITVLASRVNAPLLQHNPNVDRVVLYPSDRNLIAKLRLCRELRREGYDLVIDPVAGTDLEPALVAWAVGARLAVGFGGDGREVCFDRVADPVRCRPGLVGASFDLLRLIGVEDPGARPELFPTGAEVQEARDWLSRHTRTGRVRVGIHPGAHYASQRWGVRNYSDLIGFSHPAGPVEWILIGGPADAGILTEIHSALNGGIPVFTGELRQAMALISLLDGLVCNNSGPLHMAAALGTPTVSFMGPTASQRWWPVGEHHRVLRDARLNCLGCERGVCPRGTDDCMRNIAPAMAWDALTGVLREVRENPPRRMPAEGAA